jgi:LysR family transcriptional regulator, transcriptional activator for bauABCD operon
MRPKSWQFNFSPTDLRLLRVFQAVVRHEGFAAAQDALGLSAGTISNHINHLEARFGVRLCERGRKGFSLTPDGARIHEAAENLLRSVEHFSGTVGSVRGELSGTVHLGTVDAMHTNAEASLDRAIAHFSSVAPKVMLHVEIASPQDLMQRLLDGRHSLIITPIEAVHPSIVARPLFREEQRLYCGRGHPLFDAANVTMEQVRSHPYAGRTYMQSGSHLRDQAFDWRAMTSHMEALAILIKSGRFLGYLPEHFARSFVERGEMKNLLGEVAAHFDSFFLAHRRDERNRASTVLAECLVGALTVPDRKA